MFDETNNMWFRFFVFSHNICDRKVAVAFISQDISLCNRSLDGGENCEVGPDDSFHPFFDMGVSINGGIPIAGWFL